MQGILTLVLGVVVLHIANLHWLSLYCHGFTKSGALAPRRVLFSRPHVLGVTAATFGVIVFVASALAGTLKYGVLPAVGLLCLDGWLSYRAVNDTP